MKEIVDKQLEANDLAPHHAYSAFVERFHTSLQACGTDPEVVGFKSIACYRTGLDIVYMQDSHKIEQCLTMVMLRYEATRTMRLADKTLNDYIVNVALHVSSGCGKPGE